MTRLFLLVAPLLLAGTTAAQTPPSPAPPASPPPAAQPTPTPEYVVGPGDVLEVAVFGNEDLSRAATVQPNGTISLPLLGEVPVADLTVAEAKDKLTSLLRSYLVSPQVEVKVREYQSQFVIVVGEVNRTGKVALRGSTRLIDVLVEAGGFTPRASGEVIITRANGTFDGGQKKLRMRLGSGSLTPQDEVNLRVILRSGDILTASPKSYVIVEGEVNRPGRYVIENELTLTGAIAMAGGITRFGSSSIKIIRTDSRTLNQQPIDVDFKAIRKGKKPDIALLPNDRVSVPRRTF